MVLPDEISCTRLFAKVVRHRMYAHVGKFVYKKLIEVIGLFHKPPRSTAVLKIVIRTNRNFLKEIIGQDVQK